MNSTTTFGIVKHFDWTEYVVFVIMLGISLVIGLYFGIYKGGQNTVTEYLLGNKQMSIFPVSMSLISSQISGVTLLGVPTEIYTYGSQYAAVILSNILVAVATLAIFLPVFYKLQLLSLFEYLELRFSKSVRIMASLLYVVSTILFIPIVIYGPAIALNQVSGLDLHLVTPVICSVCILYTMMGGLRAVVWTDAIQGVTMVFAVLGVLILGIIKAGGFTAIFEKAAKGDRLELFNMDPDPSLRISFWSVVVGYTFSLGSYIATDPGVMQRFISLPTYRQAQTSEYCLLFGILLFAVPSIFIGLIMYAVYKDCDPLTAKVINRPDQILPYFVLDVAEHIKGLPGLFVVGIFSAALSTMSTGLNTVSGAIYEDFIQPCLKSELSDKAASSIMKLIVVLTGMISIALVFVVDKMGAIMEICTKFSGVTNGTTLGIFTLGVLFPSANYKGALAGGITSFVVMAWIMVGNSIASGNGLIKYAAKPVSVEGCHMAANLTRSTLVTESFNHVDGEVWPIYKLCMFYFAMVGCLIVIVVGMIVSHLTGALKPETLNPDLFCPLVFKKAPKPSFSQVELEELQGNYKKA